MYEWMSIWIGLWGLQERVRRLMWPMMRPLSHDETWAECVSAEAPLKLLTIVRGNWSMTPPGCCCHRSRYSKCNAFKDPHSHKYLNFTTNPLYHFHVCHWISFSFFKFLIDFSDHWPYFLNWCYIYIWYILT